MSNNIIINNNEDYDSITIPSSTSAQAFNAVRQEKNERIAADENLQNQIDEIKDSGGSEVVIDDTLTVSGAAADSKVVGDKLNEKEDKSNKVTELSNASTDTQYPSAKAVYDELELKADKQNQNGGFAAGDSSQAQVGGAIGLFATTQNGAAIGLSANSTYGGAVGSGAITDDGGAVGDSADASDGGGAVGCQARAEYGGGAIGKSAYAVRGFAGGERAYAPTDTIQLGTGTNTKSKTLQVYNYTVMEADGSLPYVHTARPYIKTENAETLELNSIYNLGIQSNLTLQLPTADYGNFIQVDFISDDTATTLTISATRSALISDYDFIPESNKIYSLFFDYGRLDATNYGWRFSYAEYSYTPESEG